MLPARYGPITKFRKRVYVPKGGIPFLSSKQLFQIDPIDVKRPRGLTLRTCRKLLWMKTW